MDFASSFADNSGKPLELESPRRIAVHLNQQVASFRATGIINQVATKPESTCVKSLPQLIAKFAEIV